MGIAALVMGAFDRAVRGLLRLRGFKSHAIETGAGRLHVYDVPGGGDLPPILLLHGLGSCAQDYAQLILALRGHTRRLIAPDLPGHGYSPIPEEGMDPDRLPDAMLEAVDALLTEPAIVIGNSLGGLSAIRFAQARPDRVRALVLSSPGGAPIGDEGVRGIRELFRIRTHADGLDVADRFLGRPSVMRHVLAWGIRVRMASRGVRDLVERIDSSHMLTPDDLRGLARVPTLLFWGAADQILHPDQAEFFRDHLPDPITYEAPEGYGHSPHSDTLKGFAKRVLVFLKPLREEPEDR